MSTNTLPPALSDWAADGHYINMGPFQHSVFAKQYGEKEAAPADTLLLLHGFPESSFSYAANVEGLLAFFKRIILFDFLGYGMSDKPVTAYTYSLFEQTDCALQVWKHYGVSGGHLLAHDMGDTVLTELIARSELDVLPAWFSAGILSATFTNGNMVLEKAKLRITQKWLLTKRGGPILGKLLNFPMFRQQVKSTSRSAGMSEEAIQLMWTAICHKEGRRLFHVVIRYLNDRKRFQNHRWLPPLKHTKIPLQICWGDQDVVAPLAVAHFLRDQVMPQAKFSLIEGVGHFAQIEAPAKWLAVVSPFWEALKST
ncbi:MAG: alpha/beta hydrolase [Saprospiraceae bacterium]|nr:alpha/beta hydrolase [Saprospiraceae bacterium]